MKYKVYATHGGLMEDPKHHDEDVEIIEAESPDEAIESWLGIHTRYDSEYLVKGEDGKGWRSYFPISCERISAEPLTIIREQLEILKNNSKDAAYGRERKSALKYILSIAENALDQYEDLTNQ